MISLERESAFKRFWQAYKNRTSMPIAFPHSEATQHWEEAAHWDSEINAAIAELRELDELEAIK